ncbi:hypothetical protein MBT42_12645 [Streptomyces sp. MBT42]|uniref:HAD family hydrolase n=1 Tax=Streptomyces sp. MBT42 TaxID=1488373 RepID=UPI001E2E41B7|nr:hypothetical protein [Streptomyces sp. MBT42]MCD2464404.1 hypothetical protein [Streptomyces sp. MBT42]
MHIYVTSCTLIGDSLTDIRTAHASGATAIGYANKPHEVDEFTEAQADVIPGTCRPSRRTHHRVAQGTRGRLLQVSLPHQGTRRAQRGARGPSPGPALLSPPRSSPAAVRTPDKSG